MKKEFAALFFYMLYMIAMMRPVMPILEYYANYEYVATVLCENRDKPALACNGKCYLEKEMKKIASSHSSHKHHNNSTVPQIDFTKYPVAPLDKNEEFTILFEKLVTKSWRDFSGKPKQFMAKLFRPPLAV